MQDDIEVISMWVVRLWSLWKANVDSSCVLVSLVRCNDDAPHVTQRSRFTHEARDLNRKSASHVPMSSSLAFFDAI